MSPTERREDALRALVNAARAGDGSAFRHLVESCSPRIRRWALARTGDPDAADEVEQRVLIRLHRYLDGWDGRGRFTSWLYRVTANAANSVLAEARGREREADGARRVLEALEASRSPGPTRRPEDPGANEAELLARMWAADVAELVRTFFNELPPRQREVFDLADLQGYGPTEIAEMMEMNPSTVRAHLFKARRTIRRRTLARHPELAGGYGR